MCARLAHCRRAEADLVIAARKMPIDGREEKATPDGRCGDASHQHLVDGDFCEANALHDPSDGPVVLKTSEDDRVWSTGVQVTKTELEGIAVQPGGRREFRKAGPQDSRPAQRDHRQYRAEKGASDRNGRTTALSLEGVADTDHRARRCTRRCEMAYHR